MGNIYSLLLKGAKGMASFFGLDIEEAIQFDDKKMKYRFQLAVYAVVSSYIILIEEKKSAEGTPEEDKPYYEVLKSEAKLCFELCKPFLPKLFNNMGVVDLLTESAGGLKQLKVFFDRDTNDMALSQFLRICLKLLIDENVKVLLKGLEITFEEIVALLGKLSDYAEAKQPEGIEPGKLTKLRNNVIFNEIPRDWDNEKTTLVQRRMLLALINMKYRYPELSTELNLLIGGYAFAWNGAFNKKLVEQWKEHGPYSLVETVNLPENLPLGILHSEGEVGDESGTHRAIKETISQKIHFTNSCDDLLLGFDLWMRKRRLETIEEKLAHKDVEALFRGEEKQADEGVVIREGTRTAVGKIYSAAKALASSIDEEIYPEAYRACHEIEESMLVVYKHIHALIEEFKTNETEKRFEKFPDSFLSELTRFPALLEGAKEILLPKPSLEVYDSDSGLTRYEWACKRRQAEFVAYYDHCLDNLKTLDEMRAIFVGIVSRVNIDYKKADDDDYHPANPFGSTIMSVELQKDMPLLASSLTTKEGDRLLKKLQAKAMGVLNQMVDVAIRLKPGEKAFSNFNRGCMVLEEALQLEMFRATDNRYNWKMETECVKEINERLTGLCMLANNVLERELGKTEGETVEKSLVSKRARLHEAKKERVFQYSPGFIERLAAELDKERDVLLEKRREEKTEQVAESETVQLLQKGAALKMQCFQAGLMSIATGPLRSLLDSLQDAQMAVGDEEGREKVSSDELTRKLGDLETKTKDLATSLLKMAEALKDGENDEVRAALIDFAKEQFSATNTENRA